MLVEMDVHNQLYNSVISAALVYGLDESTQKALMVHDDGVSLFTTDGYPDRVCVCINCHMLYSVVTIVLLLQQQCSVVYCVVCCTVYIVA